MPRCASSWTGGGIEGVRAAILHNVADMLHQMVVDKLGVQHANLAEANWEFYRLREKESSIERLCKIHD